LVSLKLQTTALHPEAQQKLHDEILRVLGPHEPPTYKNFNDLPYTLAIMNEALRLYPLVLQIPKWTGEGPEVKTLGPFVLPPKTSVNITNMGLHYNPKSWGEDADKFRPERFLSDPTSVSKSNWDRNAWSPFSEGPRSCLGKKFSQVEFVAALAMLVQRYEVGLAKGVDPTTVLDSTHLLTLKPKVAVKLEFRKRKY
jgi:cytochrome P450